jgi:hypothetical protein
MKVLVVGGPRQITQTFFEHLEEEGITVQEYQEDLPCNVPQGAEGVININSMCSHKLSNWAKDAADKLNIPYASVDHKWSKARPILIARGFVTAVAPATPQEAGMSSANGSEAAPVQDLVSQVKAIAGSMQTETRDEIRKLKEQVDALAALLNESNAADLGKIRAQIKDLQDEFKSLYTELETTPTGEDLNKVTAQLAALRKELDQLKGAEHRSGPETLEQIPVSTRKVADELLKEMQAKFPHPITRVRWEDAAKVAGVKPQTLIEALTVLHGDSGLNGQTLAVLHRCGWRLALVQHSAPNAPRAWLLETGASVALPVEEPAPQGQPEPLASVTVSPVPLVPVTQALVAPINPFADPAVRRPGNPQFYDVQDSSSTGKVFQCLVDAAGQEMNCGDVAMITKLDKQIVAKRLSYLKLMDKPRKGFTVEYNESRGTYKAVPLQA